MTGPRQHPHRVATAAARGEVEPPLAAAGLVVRTVADLGAWRGDWDDLVVRAPVPTPFLRSWWLRHVALGAPRFVLVLERGRLIGGMALQEDRVLGLPRYRVLGHSSLVPDHLDALAAADRRAEVVAALGAWCRRPGRRLFDLDGVVDDSLFARVVPGPVAMMRIGEARYRKLPDDPAEVVPGMSGTEKSAVRRGRKKLERAGATYRLVPAGEVDRALALLHDLHERRWGQASGFLGRFDAFAAAAREGARHGEVQFHELVHDGRVLCVLVDLHVPGRACTYQEGRDPDSALPSPASVLQAYAVEHACRRGASEYDFLRGPQPYKQGWTDHARPLVRLRAWHGAPARAVLALLTARERAGAVKGRLRRDLVRRGRDARAAVTAVTDRVRRRLAAGATTEVLRDPADLEALRADWDALPADVAGPSTHLDWVLAYGGRLRDDERLCVVVVRDDGRLTGVAPLVEGTRRPRRLRLLTSDPTGFRGRDEQQLARLVDAVLGLRLPLVLEALVHGSTTARLLETRAGRRGLVVARPRFAGPSLPLDERWREPFGQLGRNSRKDTRRRRRRAEERGEVVAQVRDPGADLPAALEELLRVEASGWKGRAGTALVHDASEREPLFAFLSAPEVRPAVRVASLTVAGATAAIEVGVVLDRRWWPIKAAYDEDFAPFAPGLLLTGHCIGWAAAEGLETYEFMGVTARDKEMWGAPPLPLRAIRVYPATVGGAAALTGDVTAKALRRARRVVARPVSDQR